MVCPEHQKDCRRKSRQLRNWECPPDHKGRISEFREQPCQWQNDDAQTQQGDQQRLQPAAQGLEHALYRDVSACEQEA